MNLDQTEDCTGKRMIAADEVADLSGFECTNALLRRASRRLTLLYDGALSSVHLKATQLSLIYEIHRLGNLGSCEAPTLQNVAIQLGVHTSALTHALKPLRRDGLIDLLQDAEDGRAKRVVLTKVGLKRLQEAMPVWESANRRLEDVLGTDAASMLRQVADQIVSTDFLLEYCSQKRK